MSTQQSELLGQLVGEGRFLISRCLRDGGMAQIYQGEDTTTGTPVIVKVPKLSQVLIDNSFRQRFLREVQTLKRLVHPNIVRILCSGEEKGVPFVVMRYLDGGTLGDRMYTGAGQTARPQPPESLGTWLPTIAQVLDYVHGQNYVHRDVKPYNILFDTAGKAFLGDLGIARALATQPDLGSITPEREQPPGTRPYMAPEQITRQKVGPYTDQFALAVVAYEWLTGRRPFVGDTLEEIARSQHQPPTPLKFALPGLPEAVSQAVARALSFNPQDRFPSCRDFAHQVMASMGLATPQSKPASATQVANNPDTWSVPLSEFEPMLQRNKITASPPPSTPREMETAPKTTSTRREPPAPLPVPVEPAVVPSSPLLRVIRWSALVALLVLAALAGSFFLPGTAVQRIVGSPLDSLLKSISAPGWNRNDGDRPAPAANQTEKPAADPRLFELEREKALLAQKLDAAVAQLAKSDDARTESEKDKKTAEDRLAAGSEKLKTVEEDYKSAVKAKADAESRLTAAKDQLKKAEDKLSKLDSDKGGIAKELDTLRADLKEARESARTAAQKAKEAAAKELADAKEKLAAESAKAKKAADDLQTAQMEKDTAARRLAAVQERLKLLDDTLKQVMVCFVLYNRTDAAISFEIRYLSRTGDWTEWKKSKVPPFAETNQRARYQSANGAIAIQLRYETDAGSKIMELDGQVFRGKRNPSAADIDTWYAFVKSGAEIALKRVPRK
jgi:serine/threonine protein kinase